MLLKRSRRAGVTAVALSLTSFCASAATLSDLGLSQAQISAINAQIYAPNSAPAMAFGSPIGYGAAYGQGFGAVGGQTVPKVPGNDSVDGSASLGGGVGDAVKWVGLEAVVTAISVKDDFGEDGDFSFKIHHVLPWKASVALGVENTARWGHAKGTSESYYAAATKVFVLNESSAASPMSVALNLGIGTNRFVAPGTDGANVFGGIAFLPIRQVSLIADYTGRDLNAGLSVVPLARLPLSVTVGAVNLGKKFGNRTEFAGVLGYTFTY